MKYILASFFLFINFFSMAQQKKAAVKKDFKTTTNKIYIGTNIAPMAVAFLNGDNFQTEWKVLYKQRLAPKNHFLRAAYSFQNDLSNQRSTSYVNFFGENIQPVEIELNDSMVWRTGPYKNNQHKHFMKLGYEYQFMVGSKRKFSLNLGADLLVGMEGSKLYMANDTITYENIQSFGQTYRSITDATYNNQVIQGINVFTGFSPTFAVGMPIKNRFDLTFEMAFDCIWSKYAYYGINSFDLNYRPSLMLSYRFDEEFVRAKRSNKKERK